MARETNSRFGTAASFGMVAVVIGALSGALYWQSQLTTSRPAPSAGEPAPRRPPGKVRARLWEDPLAAVRHQVGLPCGERGSAPDGSPGLVLPVYLWGGDSFEDHENRLRSRYAVLAALDAAGYMPEDAEHLRFRCLAAGTVIVPYEWFFRNPLQPASRAGTVSRPPSPGWESILVIWVSDQLLSARPLESLRGVEGQPAVDAGGQQREEMPVDREEAEVTEPAGPQERLPLPPRHESLQDHEEEADRDQPVQVALAHGSEHIAVEAGAGDYRASISNGSRASAALPAARSVTTTITS